jgi:hypothetical protein
MQAVDRHSKSWLTMSNRKSGRSSWAEGLKLRVTSTDSAGHSFFAPFLLQMGYSLRGSDCAVMAR